MESRLRGHAQFDESLGDESLLRNVKFLKCYDSLLRNVKFSQGNLSDSS